MNLASNKSLNNIHFLNNVGKYNSEFGRKKHCLTFRSVSLQLYLDTRCFEIKRTHSVTYNSYQNYLKTKIRFWSTIDVTYASSIKIIKSDANCKYFYILTFNLITTKLF